VENIYSIFDGAIVIGCPVRFEDQPKRRWAVDRAFCIERSDGADDSTRTLVTLGFIARLLCTKEQQSRLVAILYDRIVRVDCINDRSITFVFMNIIGIERSVTFIKNNSKEINLIHAA
jgi:hypothetical protein